MQRNEPAKKIVFDMLAKHEGAATRTLARHLHEQYPHEWPTIEKARGTIRYYRGNKGDTNRKDLKKSGKTSHVRKNAKPFTFAIPPGINQVLPPVRFTDVGKWLLISDVHIPYHDQRAFHAAIEFAVKVGCKHLYINGDWYDFYGISDYSRDPQMRSPDGEMALGFPVLEQASKAFKGRKVFKVGNHEERYEKYLWNKAPALLGIKSFRINEVLGLDGLGFDYIASKQLGYIGSLPILHGHELPKGLTSPVNIARGVFLRAQGTAIVGHWHRTSTHIETSGIEDRMITCYSVGCLCDMKPSYAPINAWNHGFAIVTVNRDLTWRVSNHTIVDGKVTE